MKITGVKNVIWKLLVCSMGFMLGILTCLVCAVFSNSKLEFSEYAENNSAYAVSYQESTPPTIKTDEITVVPIVGGVEMNSSEKMVIDVTDGEKWHSKLSADSSVSLLSKIGIKFYFNDYTYMNYTTWWIGKVNSTLVSSTSVGGDNPSGAAVTTSVDSVIYGLNSSEINVTGIWVSGTTWYGQEISNSNILENDGKNVVAGNYLIEKISFDYNFNLEYVSYSNLNIINVTGSDSGESLETEVVTKEQNYAASFECTTNLELFITTTVAFGSSIGGQIENNLYINPVYDSTTQWINNIVLYDSNVSSSEAASDDKHFYYSFSDGTRKPFQASYGFSTLLNNTTFGAESELFSGGGSVAAFLRLVWYREKELQQQLADADTVNAGTYYIQIEGATEGAEYFYYDSIDGQGRYYAVRFLYNRDNYIQELTVAKATLKVSIKDGIGISVEKENDVISAPFISPYTEAVLFSDQNGQNMPSGTYFEKQSDNTFVATTDNRFSFLKTYYINKSSAAELFTNLVSGMNAGTAWEAMGGYENDLNSIINSTASLLSFAG